MSLLDDKLVKYLIARATSDTARDRDDVEARPPDGGGAATVGGGHGASGGGYFSTGGGYAGGTTAQRGTSGSPSGLVELAIAVAAPRAFFWTTPALPGEEGWFAQVASLSPTAAESALLYFQSHGYPWLSSVPTPVDGHWHFPELAALGTRGTTEAGSPPGQPPAEPGVAPPPPGQAPGRASPTGGGSGTGEGPPQEASPPPGGEGEPSPPGGPPADGGPDAGSGGPSAGGTEGGSGTGEGPGTGQGAGRGTLPAPTPVHPPPGPVVQAPSGQVIALPSQWSTFYGPAGVQGGPTIVFADDHIDLVPIPTDVVGGGGGSVGGTPSHPTHHHEDFATAEEEFEVARQSAWNWLLNQMLKTTMLSELELLYPGLYENWRFPEPSTVATTGYDRDLRDSYDAMQDFLSVIKLAGIFVTPATAAASLRNGLPARAFKEFIQSSKIHREILETVGDVAASTSRQVARAVQALRYALGRAPDKVEVRAFLNMTDAWAEFRSEGIADGLPLEDLGPYSALDVNIVMLRGSRQADFAAANKLANFTRTPNGYTWHHDIEFGNMMLIRTELHAQIPHWGGVSIWKAITGQDYP